MVVSYTFRGVRRRLMTARHDGMPVALPTTPPSEAREKDIPGTYVACCPYSTVLPTGFLPTVAYTIADQSLVPADTLDCAGGAVLCRTRGRRRSGTGAIPCGAGATALCGGTFRGAAAAQPPHRGKTAADTK